VAWCDATVPVMTALLAQWWFTNCLARRDLVVAFVIVSCSPGGIVATVRVHVVALGSLVAFVGRSTNGIDRGLRGQGPRWLGRS
jgi:hypothetical protein